MRILATAAVVLVVSLGAASSVGATPNGTHADGQESWGYGWPGWWNGSDCDAQHWDAAAAAQGWTGAGAHELGASYLGVPVCGPGPMADGAPKIWWTNWGGGELEWSDTELAFRFMAVVYGTGAYPATGATVVSNYRKADGGYFTKFQNGTTGRTPLPGSILSFSSTSSPAGHVAIVTGSSVDQTGNGSVTVMSQDDTSDGWRTLTVSNWTIQGYGDETPTAWLADSSPFGYGYPGSPLPGFTASPDTPGPGTPVFFNAEDSQDPIGNIWDYEWQFGDGTYGSGEYALHTYASSGTYSVTLTATDDLGSSSSVNEQVTVGGASHVFSIDRGNGALREGSWTGSAWQFQTVDGPGASGAGHTGDKLSGPIATSTPGGAASVWYFDAKTGALRGAFWTGSSWDFRIVDGRGSSGAGHTTDKLGGSVVATTLSGNTTTCFFQPPPTSCSSPEIPHLWYLDTRTGALRHAWWTGTTWEFQVVDGLGAKTKGHTRDPLGSVAAVTYLDTDPLLWYIDTRTDALREAVWSGKAWTTTTLDGPGSKFKGHTTDKLVGPVVATMPYENPSVSYFDARTGALRDVYWTGAWRFSKVDGPHAAGTGHTSNRLGGSVASAAPPLAPQMWYLDARTGALRHAWWENWVWRSEIVDGPHATTSGATHDRLSGPLAVVAPDGVPSVFYIDARTGDIEQATWTGAAWQVTTLAEGNSASAVAAAVF